MTKLTKRDIFTALVNFAETGTCDLDSETLKTFAEKEIAALDRKAQKAKETAQKRAAATDDLTTVVADALTGDYESIADIAARIDGPDVTVAKVTYRLNALVKAGAAEKTEITIPGGDGYKSRKVVAFRAVTTD